MIIMMRKSYFLKVINAFCLGCMLGLASCKPQKTDTDVAVINDSTMLDLSQYITKKIQVGNHISNKPLSSQLVRMDGAEKYLLMDNGYIYRFDWNSGVLEDSIPTVRCGLLGNYSGFTFLNADSLLVYNNGNGHLFAINSKGELLLELKEPTSVAGGEMKTAVEGLNASRPLRQNNKIILSGTMLGNLVLADGMKVPASEYVDIRTKEWKTSVCYPEKYTRHNWGSYYLNRLSVTQDSVGRFLYSFPVCAYILRYDSDFSSCDTLLMRSRYDKGMVECELTAEDFDDDPSKEIRYYISQTSYSHILYDAYRRLYLRLVEHPLQGWSGKGSFCKPISVIVADMNGNVLSESRIALPAEKFYYNNIHICKEGLVIALENPDENNIYFACIPIKNR